VRNPHITSLVREFSSRLPNWASNLGREKGSFRTVFFCSWLSDTQRSVQLPWNRLWRNFLERNCGWARLWAVNMVQFPPLPWYDQGCSDGRNRRRPADLSAEGFKLEFRALPGYNKNHCSSGWYLLSMSENKCHQFYSLGII